jgi:hypothetical protein
MMSLVVRAKYRGFSLKIPRQYWLIKKIAMIGYEQYIIYRTMFCFNEADTNAILLLLCALYLQMKLNLHN